MSDKASAITPINIEDELQNSYLDYAMSVIVGRALPDVRDGLKPVHRRVLYAMNGLNNDYNKPYKKSARVVGDVIGKYHPHGDTAVYDAIVRMAQPFSLRYMLVDGQGNFGSVDGDSPAAMRYTEVRMTKLSHKLLADIDKETVDFGLNYDETEKIPEVLPTRVPNLLINGSSGIAVGMATNIPPHNLGEVVDGCIKLIDNENVTTQELMEVIPGPDFPTAGIISGQQGIIDAYNTGRGKVYMRAQTDIEVSSNGKETIVITEIPYQVNKARLIEKIAELVKDKKIEGISALRDESDKDGMRIVIESKRDASAEVILNNLFNHTQLQCTFGINMVALDNGQPKLFTLKKMLTAFVNHRREVVTRRTIFELKKARDRAHILEGLAVALVNIDEIIELIKNSETSQVAKNELTNKGWSLGEVKALLFQSDNEQNVAKPDWLEDGFGVISDKYYLTEQQAQAILDMRLHRLTGLEHQKIFDEYKSLLEQIRELIHILNSRQRLMEIIREELLEIREEFADSRRTLISSAIHDIDLEDLIRPEEVVLTLSHEGYVKYQLLTEYEAQRRGGRGKSATSMKETDFIEKLIVANTHDSILCFSTRGRLYWLKVYQLPQASRAAKGKPIVNLLPLQEDERITAILPVKSFTNDHFVVMATAHGVVKKTALDAFSRPRAGGIIAINLRDGDSLIGVSITSGTNNIMLFSKKGKVVNFHEDNIRAMGRSATGVRGINLDKDEVVSLIIPNENGDVLTITQNGFGKRTDISEYPVKGRANKGIISIKISERNGLVVGAVQVQESDEFMMITDQGTLVRTRVSEVSRIGRNTQGVTLIKTSDKEHVVGIQKIEEAIFQKDDVIDDDEKTNNLNNE